MVRPSDLRRWRRGVLRASHYRGALGLLRHSREPWAMARRYADSAYGAYPWRTSVRTPTGPVVLTLPHPHDARTVNEVFFRHDYGAGAPRVVVDVGANIGIAAAYFLSRRPDSVVHCWEPVPANVVALRANLAAFGDRARIAERALAPAAGAAAFEVEPVGRYSGLAAYYEHDLTTTTQQVECDAVADALRTVGRREGGIDLLKIDTEGSELALLAAVPDDVLTRILVVAYEHAGRVRMVAGATLVAERTTWSPTSPT